MPDPGQQGRTECPECEGKGYPLYRSGACLRCGGSGLSPVAGKDRQEDGLPPKWVEEATNRVRDLLQVETLPKHDSSSSAWQLACEIVDSIVPLVEGRQEPPAVTTDEGGKANG